jgi:hypothetical protein
MTEPTAASKYQTPEGGWVKDAPFWTIAYRTPRANRFLRVDLRLTWSQAAEVARKLADAEPGLQIHYTTTAEAEAVGYTAAEDARNIMVDSGRRVRVLEGGKLPEGVAAFAEWLVRVDARVAERYGAYVLHLDDADAYRADVMFELRLAAHAEALEEAAERQVTEWFTRHVVELKTDPTRQAYATIAYREADHAEALADDESRVRQPFLEPGMSAKFNQAGITAQPTVAENTEALEMNRRFDRDAEALAAWKAAEPIRHADGFVSHPAPPFVPAGKAWVPGLPVLVDAPAACTHAGCHPGRCAYGPDHGVPAQ